MLFPEGHWWIKRRGRTFLVPLSRSNFFHYHVAFGNNQFFVPNSEVLTSRLENTRSATEDDTSLLRLIFFKIFFKKLKKPQNVGVPIGSATGSSVVGITLNVAVLQAMAK